MQKVYQPPASYDSGSLHAAESINPEIDLQRGPDRYCLPLKHARLEFVLLNCLDRLLIEALGIRTKLGRHSLSDRLHQMDILRISFNVHDQSDGACSADLLFTSLDS